MDPSFFRRLPRPLLFALAAVLQIAAVAWMVVDRATILRGGTEVMLETTPIDPRDFLRGDYVVLRYGISTMPAGALKDRPAERKAPVYVTLSKGPDGFHRAVSAHASPPILATGDVLIQGRIKRGDNCGPQRRAYCETLTVAYGLESFFVPEGEGRELERARDDRKVAVVASVAPSGRAAIKRLMVDGKPVYDEPMF